MVTIKKAILLCALMMLSFSGIFAQNPTSPGPITGVNARYVQGTSPGYIPSAGTGLSLILGQGSAFCNSVVDNYTGGSLSLTANSTNYVYLDETAACAPAFNTSGFNSATIPIATVVTTLSSISSITDVRTQFLQTGGGSGGAPTILTNGVVNPTQALLDFVTSINNSVGLVNTPVYGTGGQESFEITGSYTGNAATATSLLNTPSGCPTNQFATSIAANGNLGCIAITADAVPILNQNTTGTAANVTGTVAISNGGTGQTTANTAFNALSPMTTLGDIEYEASGPIAARLAGNTSATKAFLVQTGDGTNSAAPAWGTIVSGDLPNPAAISVTGTASNVTGIVVPANGGTGSALTPTTTQIPVGNLAGTAYIPRTLSGDATISSSGVLTLATSGVTTGSYTNSTITVDAKGRVTAAASGTPTAFQVNGTPTTSQDTINFESGSAFNGLTPTISNPSAGNVQVGLSGLLTSAGMSTTGVTAASYTNSTITVDAEGRVTAAANGSAGAAFYQTIQNNGTPETQRGVLNFTTNITCVDNSGNGSTDCSASGGGGGTVGVNGSTVTNPNFNGTTPTAQSNNVNATLQVSSSNVSIQFPIGALPAGTAVASSDTGTPSLTFGTNSITASQPITLTPTTNQIVAGASAHQTILNFPAPSGATATLTFPNTTQSLAAVGSVCSNQVVTAESTTGPTCTTLTSAYVDNSIALTGVDINTSNQVTATHLATALPVSQGGTGITAGTTGKVLGGATPSMVTVTSAYVDNSIALTGTDINTSNQVTATHLASALPIAQGGTSAATQLAAAIALLPTATRAGDVLYWDGTNWNHLAGNNSGTNFLQESSSGVPVWAAAGGVSSIGTTGPISGGTITSTGTISCPTCVTVASTPSVGIAHFAGSTQAVTSSAVDLSGVDATGILAAARFPALTGDVTTASGALGSTVGHVHFGSTVFALSGTAPGVFQGLEADSAGSTIQGVTLPEVNLANYSDNTGGIAAAYASGQCPSTGCTVAASSNITIASGQTITLVTGKMLTIDLKGHTATLNCGSAATSLIVTGDTAPGGDAQPTYLTPFTLKNGQIACSGSNAGATGLDIEAIGNWVLDNLTFSGFPSAGSAWPLLIGQFADHGTIRNVNVLNSANMLLNKGAYNSFYNDHFVLNTGLWENTGSQNYFNKMEWKHNIGSATPIQFLAATSATNQSNNHIENSLFLGNGTGSSSSAEVYFNTGAGAAIFATELTNNNFFACSSWTGTTCNTPTSAGPAILFSTTGLPNDNMRMIGNYPQGYAEGYLNLQAGVQTVCHNNGIVDSCDVNEGIKTGTGAIVLATSPTLVTPSLGTPSAINLSNATALPCGATPALTGDVTTAAGNCSTTLATVNSNPGSYTNATITVNGKGLVTAASSGSSSGITGSGTTNQLALFTGSTSIGGDTTATFNTSTKKVSLDNLALAPAGTAVGLTITGDAHLSDPLDVNLNGGTGGNGMKLDSNGNLTIKGSLTFGGNTATYRDSSGATYADILLYGGNSPNAQPFIGFFTASGGNPVKLYGDSARTGVFADSAFGDFTVPVTSGVTAPEMGNTFLNKPHGTLANLPAACTIGDTYFATDQAAGVNDYECSVTGSPGTWIQPSAIWSSLFAPTGNLALTMGSSTSTFNTNSALANFFQWANTTAATSSVNQSSPVLSLCGQGWEGGTPANTKDCWALQNVLANGANPNPTFTLANTGSSTGTMTVAIPDNTSINTPGATAVTFGETVKAAALVTTGAGNGGLLMPSSATTAPNGLANFVLYTAAGNEPCVVVNTTGTTCQPLPQTVILHSNFTDANTTFTTVSDGTLSWSWPVLASTDHKLDCTFYYQGATATTNSPNIRITGPASPTAVTYGVEGYNGTTFVSANAQAFSTSLDPFGTLGTDTLVYMANIHMGLANGSTAGTVTIQAKNTTGTDVMTIEAGSACTFQ